MLKVSIIAVGRDKDPWITEGIEHYKTLLLKYAALSITILPSVKNASALPVPELKRQEGELFSKEMSRGGYTIALSDSGKPVDSLAFADMLRRLSIESGGRVNFLIGGAYGLDDKILTSANSVLSLSPLTMSHQVVRLVLLEQLYRGFTILAGTAYHK
ncbi:MAG: 23S rRNA (pseudouridine(1915)-N(3))-methyltransferase RlmH [candidate division Zixibacteria bacterium]|nr:23S rRNA (pseudouridine(1915)-N(3))-methyltransferase RlmH [candidate division Zixibacteria bacterium]